jgi:hypothetical protein
MAIKLFFEMSNFKEFTKKSKIKKFMKTHEFMIHANPPFW